MNTSANLTSHDIHLQHCYIALIIDRCVTPIWYVLGIVGNLLAAFVWLQWRMRRNSSSAIYLASLSINDTVVLLLHPIQELKYAWAMRSVDYPFLCESYALLFLVSQYIAPCLVLCFTIDRYIAICFPFRKHTFCTPRRAIKVVLICVLLCLALGSVQPYFWTYNRDQNVCTVREEIQIGGALSVWGLWALITEIMIFFMIPLLILAINLRVIREIYRISNQSDLAVLPHQSNRRVQTQRSTCSQSWSSRKPHNNGSSSSSAVATNAMLLSVSFYVIFTTLPATIVYVMDVSFPEGDYNMALDAMASDNTWKRHFIYFYFSKIVNEICLSHYACNFVLFALTGQKFRNAACCLLTCRRLDSESELLITLQTPTSVALPLQHTSSTCTRKSLILNSSL